LAKHARDQWIAQMCQEHPELIEHCGLDTNKGYGTKRYLEGIAEHGLSPWHRRSFKVKK
jgi:ribonuclease HII